MIKTLRGSVKKIDEVPKYKWIEELTLEDEECNCRACRKLGRRKSNDVNWHEEQFIKECEWQIRRYLLQQPNECGDDK